MSPTHLVLISLLTSLMSTTSNAEAPATENRPDPIYVSMHPHFIVNLADDPRHFIQMKAKAQVEDKATREDLRLHMPAVHHNLILLLSQLTQADMASVKKKELMRKNVTESIRKTLEQYAEHHAVKNFFITSLIVQ
ncbi:MAG: flagellar basal body-associated FliL family protein [Gammaproteobacteria bacterium]|nr:flagellar basal body-associated FliL family protein [Gammaproteobacteria bacterium]